ncbi:hypothetical protein HQ531_02180 [bacterium]|nr:hypothetical protein [bacterium]
MKHMMRIGLALLLIIALLPGGEYADAFLLASLYPQVQSMGHSTAAFAVGSGHALNNPAGFANGSTSYISMAYENFSGLSTNLGMEATLPIGENYLFGITLIHNGIDGLTTRPNLSQLTLGGRRDSVFALAGSDGSEIAYREDAAFLSIARQYEFEINLGWKFFKIPCRLPVGASIKYLDKLLVNNRGLGTGIDLGGQFFFDLGGMNDILINTEFSIGLFLSDILNTPVYWSTDHQDAIKRNTVLGYAISQDLKKYASIISFSSSIQTRYQNVAQYGAEINIKDIVFMRGGYDGYMPSFGLGIGLKKFIIGYSFSHHELSEIQKIEINYHF